MSASVADLKFEHSFAALPSSFYTRLAPTPLPAPYLVCGSTAAAALIGLDPAAFAEEDFLQAFSGNRPPAAAQPLAAVYSGHQFGVWAGQLGDGRAILLGEVDAPAFAPTGKLELQLKGSGQTPYSRMGDGRAVLRSSIREFLCSEAMAALGIPTSRALCVIGSDHARDAREAGDRRGGDAHGALLRALRLVRALVLQRQEGGAENPGRLRDRPLLS